MDLIAENRALKEALLGVRGLCVLEASNSSEWGAWRMAVKQIDATLTQIGMNVGMLGEAERDDVPSLREEREMRDAKLDDPRRGCVPPYFKR